MNIDIAVCLPREAETVALLRSTITDALRLFGATDDCIDDIKLAVSEAATNVIDHAGDEDEYEVAVHVDDLQCAISVKNSGRGFDSSTLDGGMPSQDSARGRGIAIMHAIMDNFDLTSAPETGTIVHLVKNLTVRPDSPLGRLRQKSSRNNRS